jgi:hypothetical protein
VKEHIVGWLRPSFADLLRRWPTSSSESAYVTLKAKPDTPQGAPTAMAEVHASSRGRRDPRLARRAGEHLRTTAAGALRVERAASRHFGSCATART